MLVKYKCGCVGFPPEPDPEKPGNLKSWIVDCCDSDAHDDHYSLAFREFGDYPFTELTPKDSFTIMSELSRLVYHGYRLRDVRHMLSKEGA